MHPLEQVWESLRREYDASCSRQARTAREAVTAQLNQLLRRLRQYRDEGEWLSILAESASLFAPELAIFEVQGKLLKLRAVRGMELAPELAIPMTAAFANAVEAKDPVVALRSASEVGTELSLHNARARLLPVANGDRIVALVFAAENDETDPNALELVTGIASAVLERRTNADLHAQITSLQAPAPAPSKKRSLPAWSELSQDEQSLHLRAQRFARVSVAEAQLARPEACAAGREGKNVYLFLKAEIDKGRDTYRKRFMRVPSMVDYLHLELVRVLADGDEGALGVEYPGAMV